MDQPTQHLLLRDRQRWLGQRRGLAVDADGVLSLARLPGPADGRALTVATPMPQPREVSGIALGPCDAVWVADTAHNRVWFEDGLCGDRVALPVSACAGAALPPGLPGHFASPRGLAFNGEALWVADSGHGRVQGLAVPDLAPYLAWPVGTQPTSLACDAQGRVVTVDGTTGAVRRFGPHGEPDPTFDALLAAALAVLGPAPNGLPAMPHQVAVVKEADAPGEAHAPGAGQGALWISDRHFNTVWVWPPTGGPLQAVPGPAGWLPGALAVQGSRAYVADASDGSIHVFEGGQWLCRLPLWSGPVSAMAVSPAGDLFIKPGLDERYIRFAADLSVVPLGELWAGPFDAGEARAWERAWVELAADAPAPAGSTSPMPAQPPATRVELQVALQAAALPAPTAAAYQTVPTGDALLAPWATGSGARFVWLRLCLVSESSWATPRVAQVRAATPSENWLDHLPQTFGLSDQPTAASPNPVEGLLSRWLKLVRGEFTHIDGLIDDMPRWNDPAFTPHSVLPWLASWLALELPRVAADAERRALIAQAWQLHARGGTPASMAAWVERHTGIRPAIVEAFAQRRAFVLNAGCRLDFDTQLPALDPLGMVVPDDEMATAGDTPCAVGNATEPMGRAVVGESGPLTLEQLGQPLYAEAAWRFCVVVDAHRAASPGVLDELRRIVDREKPAHTDWRLELVQPDMRVGFQARLGIDTIVGGHPPPRWLAGGQLGVHTELADAPPGRVGEQALDGTLTLM